MDRKILVVGKTGQVACELQRAAWPAGFAVQYLERPDIDLARPDEARAAVLALRPDMVVNAAAHTAVDAAESEPDLAFAINRDGPAALAEACVKLGAPLVHYSTDYVYDGSKPGPYAEDDPINPLSVYGRSKAEGDAAIAARLGRHVILRTSWVYSATGQNFVKTMLRLGAEREELRIVGDQHGAPTAAADIAAATVAVCTQLAAGRDDGFGVFHFTGAGATTWYGFAREIFTGAERRGLKTPRAVEPIATDAYPTAATRPRNSRLDCGKIARIYGIVAPPWQESLSACLDRLIPAHEMALAASAS